MKTEPSQPVSKEKLKVLVDKFIRLQDFEAKFMRFVNNLSRTEMNQIHAELYNQSLRTK